MDQDARLKVVNPDRPLTAEAEAQIAALARRQQQAGGLLMKAITSVGGRVEKGLKGLPKPLRSQIDSAARAALRHSYDLAGQSRQGFGVKVAGDKVHKMLGAVSGALGGIGGVPTALAELPLATTLIFRAVQGVAESYGFDPNSEDTKLACLQVFGAGGPGNGDDGIDTAFVGARLTLTGGSVNALIARIAPKFAAVLGQKLAAQAVPVLGAITGAGTNYAFIDYYTEVAHVHFGLKSLQQDVDPTLVLDEFHRRLATQRLSPN